MEQYFVELGVSKYDHINKESELDFSDGKQ